MGGLRKAGLGLGFAVLVLLGLEGVLRGVLDRSELLFTGEHPESTMHFPEPGVAMPRPEVRSSRQDGPYTWLAEHDDLGLRRSGEPLPSAPTPGTFRVLALGDSWMYGIGADQDATLPAQLEQLLPEALGRERVEVVNAGVPGGSAFEMLFWWQRLAATHHFDAVLLGKPHNRSRQDEVASYRRAWYDSYGGAPAYDLLTYLVLRKALVRFTRDPYPAMSPDEDSRAAVQDVVNLAREAEAQGLPVWMVFWPTTMEGALSGRHIDERTWYDALDRVGVPYAGHALDQRSCWGFQDLFHPSEAGYRALAEVVADLAASGVSHRQLLRSPACSDVPGLGPGKAP